MGLKAFLILIQVEKIEEFFEHPTQCQSSLIQGFSLVLSLLLGSCIKMGRGDGLGYGGGTR